VDDDVTFRKARPEDWEVVRDLLASHRLPLEGARDHLQNFVLAFDAAGGLAGVAGLERYGAHALLRSVAVAERRRGLGTALVEHILEAARATGIEDVTLLTETAPDFFARHGFQRIERSAAPASVQASIEFRTACPASAVTMRRDLRAT